MKNLRGETYRLLRSSEGIFKTDMVYLAKGSFWLISTQLVSGILTFILSIAFANLMEKEQYGVYKYLLSMGTLLGAFSLTGIGTAMTRSISMGFDGAYSQAIRTSLKWGILPTLIYLSTSTYYFINSNQILGVGMLFIALFNPVFSSLSLYSAYLIGKKDFRMISKLGSLNSIILASSVFTALYITRSVLWILLAFVVGNFVSSAISFLIVKYKYRPGGETDDQMTSYAKHLTLMDILYTIADQIDRIVIFKFFGGAELAIYSFAIAIPTQVGGLLRNARLLAFPKLAEQSLESAKESIKKKAPIVIMVSGIAVFLYILVAPMIFKIFFPKYLPSINLSRIYALSIIPATMAILPMTFLEASKNEKALYIQKTSSPIIRILLFAILGYTYGAIGMVISMVLAKTINLITLNILSKRMAS